MPKRLKYILWYFSYFGASEISVKFCYSFDSKGIRLSKDNPLIQKSACRRARPLLTRGKISPDMVQWMFASKRNTPVWCSESVYSLLVIGGFVHKTWKRDFSPRRHLSSSWIGKSHINIGWKLPRLPAAALAGNMFSSHKQALKQTEKRMKKALEKSCLLQ